MPTYTQEGIQIDSLQPVQTTVSRLPTPDDDIPTVTVKARFDWKFWAGIALAIGAGYILLKSMGHAAQLPTRKARRLR